MSVLREGGHLRSPEVVYVLPIGLEENLPAAQWFTATRNQGNCSSRLNASVWES